MADYAFLNDSYFSLFSDGLFAISDVLTETFSSVFWGSTTNICCDVEADICEMSWLWLEPDDIDEVNSVIYKATVSSDFEVKPWTGTWD